MKAKGKTTTKTQEKPEHTIFIEEIVMDQVTFCVLGVTPLIMNRIAEKARHELLLPKLAENRAMRSATLKHNPVEEFRSAAYIDRRSDAPTRIIIPGGAFKKALMTAALDTPGTATKAGIGRLCKVPDINISLYGIPYLYMDVVRNSGPQRTPDIRTRPQFPEWACKVTIRYASSVLKEGTITNLFGAAGEIIGVGDNRSEKGANSYGSWVCCAPDHPEFVRILRTQGRVAQEKALQAATPLDQDSEELLAWFDSEILRREMAPKAKPKGKKAPVEEVDEEPSEFEEEWGLKTPQPEVLSHISRKGARARKSNGKSRVSA